MRLLSQQTAMYLHYNEDHITIYESQERTLRLEVVYQVGEVSAIQNNVFCTAGMA
jgi:hypothetical protein